MAAWTFALTVSGCADRSVPTSLLGRWTSDDPRYQASSLSIQPATLTFGIDTTHSEIHAIEGVDAGPIQDGATLHVLHYRDADGEVHTLHLETSSTNPPYLRFENHPERWFRSDGTGAPRKGSG